MVNHMGNKDSLLSPLPDSLSASFLALQLLSALLLYSSFAPTFSV